MTQRLRIQSLLVTPVLVWDDGEELTHGPELGQVSVPLSKLADFGASLPAEVAALQAKMEADAVTTPDGYTAHALPDGTYSCSWGGQWLSGVVGNTPEEAIELGRAEVAKG